MVWCYSLLCCLGKLCNACHKISSTEFFVAYPTVPLSARGFPAHPQPVKWFSSYTQRGNLTSCNALTRHWYLAMPAMRPATCCAARSKCLCNSPLFLGLSFWSGTQRGEKVKTSVLAVLSEGSHPFVRKHMDIHSSGRTTQALTNLHKAWETLVFGTTHVKWTQLTKQRALPQDSQADEANGSRRDMRVIFIYFIQNVQILLQATFWS